MRYLLIFVSVFCSCSSGKDIFSSKSDYVNYNGEKYIQSRVSTHQDRPNNSNTIRTAIVNTKADTIYIYSTVLDNNEMFYSGKNLKLERSCLVVDSYYSGSMTDAVYSGVKKFSFTEILPNDSMFVDFDVDRIARIAKFSPRKIKFKYYYFEKKGRNFEGLVSIEKDRLHCGTQILNVK